MRINEFITNLFIKFAPISQSALSDLNVQLSDYYTNHLNSFKEKKMENENLAEKARNIEKKMAEAATTQDEKDALIFEVGLIRDKIVEPTLIEKAISWLDKPMVRVTLLIAFAFVAKYLSKRLTSSQDGDDDAKEDEGMMYQQQPGNFSPQQSYYQQQPYYPPFGGYYPPQQPYPNGKR